MLRFLVLLASLLATSLALQCYDPGDKLINQRCFKLVDQKLSFADARNWCHYHNPVSPSYLATVTDQTTSSFLASYARTAFNVNDGHFWIGLSRVNSTFYWDNGQPLVWSNIELNTGQNYVSEGISNGKWTTYPGDTKMPFVCSYDPNAPPTFSPFTGSTPPVTDAYTTAPEDATTGWPDVTPTPSALVVVASGACFDNGDKEIGGACYKFVAQKLSFNDARDWCHYQNPVTASYLAHVPNQFTANFLASYARSAFGQNDGYFWIGLSRTKNWTPWTWDTGYQAAFTNFNSDQLTQNWAAESVVNTKWSTFGEEEKMNFVCSYDPTAPPTFAPPTSAGPTTTPRPTSRPITTQSVPTTTGK